MNSNFSSHAGNFGDALQTQVDPRTGQFMVNFPLASLVGNHQLGPELSLSLRYSPLNTVDEGFGTGFSLGVTRFNNTSNLLQLSSGEQYRVAPGSDSVRNQKLNNFRFVYTNRHDDSEGYTVFWKEGKIEKLTRTEDGATFVTTAIISPLGRRMTLYWDWSGQLSRLSKVEDENASLCEIVYGTRTQMTIWPGTQDAYQLHFELLNDSQLDVVSRQISDSETLLWHFIYDQVGHLGNRLTLTGVDYPTGMTDRVDYNAQEGLRFPGSSGFNVRLPCVLTHTRNPGCNQPETVTQYEYTAQNFLGYNGNFGQWAANSDYLYNTLTDYTYGSTEKVMSGNVSVITERTYNNYHFLITEEVNRNGHVHRTETAYYAEQYCFIEGQPAQFQLPKEKKEIIQAPDGSKRELVTVTEFDENGNPIKQVSPDGTVTEYTYYQVEGKPGACPVEPNGFRRFMKEERVIPRRIKGTEPIHSTKYTYDTLINTDYVVLKSQSSYRDEQCLSERHWQYDNIEYKAGKKNTEFGRITVISDKLYNLADKSKFYTSTQCFTTLVNAGRLVQTTTFTGHDGLKATSKRCQSVFSGRVYSETSAQGIEIRYAYDKLGRIISRTLCPDSVYTNSTTWEYGIHPAGPYSIETDAWGNKHKTSFDGAGRALRQDTFDTETARWYATFSCQHNQLGEVSSGTVKDWLTGSQTAYPLTSEITYGGWGEKKAVSFSDGRKSLQQTDPIALTQIVYSQGGTGNTALTSASVTTTLDKISQLPLNKIVKDLTGVKYSESTYQWDGLGQLLEEQDELGQITQRTYDEYGRVLTQALPDGTVVSRTYAPHLTGNAVASISVTGLDIQGGSRTWVLGTQTFDSLGRVTQRVSGGRTTAYRYQGVSPTPSTITLPSGKTVEYTYIPELGNAVSSIKAEGISQTFNYDKQTGKLLNAQEASAKLENTWSKAGQLKEEAFLHNAQNSKAKHTYTLKGAPVSYTDITGKQTQYSMDAHGRVTSITDDSLTVNLTYDALGRLNSQTVRDKASASSLTTAFNYDSFGHEITRTVTDNRGMTLRLSQAWLKNGLLASRTTQKNGLTCCEEQYGYDTRNRLIRYTAASGESLPVDAYGHRMRAQTYRYDALNNLTSVKTTLVDRSTNTATYSYQNASDPTQLTTLTNTHDNYPKTINLSYEAEGRMTRDEAGRTLTYDVMGRLTGVSDETIHRTGTYSYDALNRLITRHAGNNDIRELYYRGAELVNEVNTSANKATRLVKTGHTCLGVSDDKGLTLTAGDKNDSLLWSEEAGTSAEGELHVWSPYGSGKTSDRLPGFNGERVDPVSGTYHLGNGYRAYNPVLMRFNCPDSLSPFGAGGINPYAYCAGDPINHTDPSGHISGSAIAGIALGTISLVFGIATLGSSIAAGGAVMAALGIVSDVTGIASASTEDSHPEASSALGWVSLATGLAGIAVGIGKWGAKKALGGSYSFGEKYREMDLAFPEVMMGKEMLPQQRIVRERPLGMRAWHVEQINRSGARFYGSNRAIRTDNVRDSLFDLASYSRMHPEDTRDIYVLTGTHGQWHGINWIRREDGSFSHRIEELRDREFYKKDLFRFGVKNDELEGELKVLGDRIHIIPIQDLSHEVVSNIIYSNAHIIGAFCYSRNDILLRHYFRLSAVTSYVKA